MGIIKHGILGELRGKLGIISGKITDGKSIIISNSNIGKGKKSIKQQINQNRMFHTRMLGSIIYEDITKEFFRANIGKSTLFAEWIKLNIGNFNQDGLSNPNGLIVSNGSLLSTPIKATAWSNPDTSIKITWAKNWVTGSENENDLASALIINEVTNEIAFTIDGDDRKSKTIKVQTLNTVASDIVNIYLFFRNQDKSISSINTYQLRS